MESKICPLEGITIESTANMEADTVSSGSVLFQIGTEDANLSLALGPVSCGGVISVLESPLPSVLKPAGLFSASAAEPTVTLPRLTGSADTVDMTGSFYARLHIPHTSVSLVQTKPGTLAGSLVMDFTSDHVTIKAGSHVHRTSIPEQTAGSWFSLHPYQPEKELVTLLYTGMVLFSWQQVDVKLEEVAGCSKTQNEPDRWYSKSQAGIRLGPVTGNVLFFTSDYDYLTPEGGRILDTLRGGCNLQVSLGIFTAGGAWTRTLHNENSRLGGYQWQDDYSTQLAIINQDITASTAWTLQKGNTLETSSKVSSASSGCSLHTSSPLQYIQRVELMNGKAGFYLIPGKGQRLEADITVKQAVLTRIGASVTITAAGIKNEFSGSYFPADDNFSWSVASSAKW